MASMRFRKSKSLGGFRLNLSKKSVGVSFGVKGFRTSVNSSGRKTTSIRIPGTGISHVSTSGGGSASPASRKLPDSPVELLGGGYAHPQQGGNITIDGRKKENQPGIALAGFGKCVCIVGIILLILGLVFLPLLFASVVALLVGIPVIIVGYVKNAHYKKLRVINGGGADV